MQNRILTRIFEYMMIAVGAAIAAFSIEEFLVPCLIMDGGIVGISIIINNLTGISLGLLTFLINIPFILFGARKLGKQFVFKSSFAVLVFSAAIRFLRLL